MKFFKLLRVKQYSKNFFVFAALLFTQGYRNPQQIGLALGAFLVMCCLGSATYIVNDIFDLERDRAHPKKQHRPLASGVISINLARGIALVLLITGLGGATLIGTGVLACGLAYLGIQVVYNIWLKPITIVDVFIIASGFVLRVIIGAVAINAQVSSWILVCTAALAFLLGFGKRRSEFLSQGENRVKSRESLEGYNIKSLDAFVLWSGAAAAICYSIYAIESNSAKEHPALIITVPFVVFGICRYLLIVFSDPDVSSHDASEPESVVIKDTQLIVAFVLFVISAAIALSGLQIGILN